MKKQTIIFIGFILLFSLLIVSGVLLFKKEEASYVMIVTKGDDMLAIKDTGEEIKLMSLEDYDDYVYTYKDNIVYLYLYKSDVIDDDKIESSILGYIDLTADDYEFTRLSRVSVDGVPVSIAVTNDYIYLTSSDYKGVYVYNIAESSLAGWNDFYELENVKLYSLSNNMMIYEEEDTFGIISMDGNAVLQVAEGDFILAYYGNIIFREYQTDHTNWIYKIYNIESGDFTIVSDIVGTDQNGVDNYIVAINDVYIYGDGSTIYRYENENWEMVYEFDSNISAINLGPDGLIYVTYSDSLKDGDITISLDLSDLEISGYDGEVYRNILYL